MKPLLRSLGIRSLAAGPLLLIAAAAGATTWTLKPDGTGDFPSIQAAVAAAVDGDEIVLEDGEYVGEANRNVSFLGKAITIRSASGDPSACVVNCDPFLYPGSCVGFDNSFGFAFVSGEGPGSVLRDLGIHSAYNNIADIGPCQFHEGGVSSFNSSPTLENLHIRDCSAIVGGGMGLTGGSPMVTGCLIEANGAAYSQGGGVYLSNSSATFENCRIVGNAAPFFEGFGGGVYSRGGSPTFRNCVITGNYSQTGGGVSANSGSFENCTIARNEAKVNGGGLHAAGLVSLTNTILWGNCATNAGSDLYNAGTVTADCSTIPAAGIAGAAVQWNGQPIHEQPLFCETLPCGGATTYGLFGIAQVSPLVNYPGCGLIGALPAGCTVSIRDSSWGKIKATYR